MSAQDLTALILTTCRDVRRAGQFLDIDFMLPSVLYVRDAGIEYHFRDASAQILFDQYRSVAERTGLPMRDVLLWAAQTWNLTGDTVNLTRPFEPLVSNCLKN